MPGGLRSALYAVAPSCSPPIHREHASLQVRAANSPSMAAHLSISSGSCPFPLDLAQHLQHTDPTHS